MQILFFHPDAHKSTIFQLFAAQNHPLTHLYQYAKDIPVYLSPNLQLHNPQFNISYSRHRLFSRIRTDLLQNDRWWFVERRVRNEHRVVPKTNSNDKKVIM